MTTRRQRHYNNPRRAKSYKRLVRREDQEKEGGLATERPWDSMYEIERLERIQQRKEKRNGIQQEADDRTEQSESEG